MTAIFAVWNNYGFSLASDSNQTASKDNQTWVDPVEKILMLEKQQIAIGAAGATFHQNVEVNEIFRTWEKTIPENGFSTMDDYFVDFARWFSSQTFAKREQPVEGLKNLATIWFGEMLEIIEESENTISLEDLESQIYSKEADSRDCFNFLGPDWEFLPKRDDLSEGILSESDAKIDELREKLIQVAPNLKTFNFLFNDENELVPETWSALMEAFVLVFKREYDLESDFDLKILEIASVLISNYSTAKVDLEVIMIGFGSDDWLPSAVSFKLYPSFFGLPRLYVSQWSNPNINWYLSIAVDSAIQELTRGLSFERAKGIFDLAEIYIDETRIQEFTEIIQMKSNEKFHQTLSRLEFLTIDRLEFVSRLFVQIEALKSFLDEPVPGVGGDTKVISMTKTTRRQKYFKEFE